MNNEAGTTRALHGACANRRSGTVPTMDTSQAKRFAEMPETHRVAYSRAVAGTASKRQAIKAFCAECCGWDRQAVTECTATACPLYRYRPWQGKAGA